MLGLFENLPKYNRRVLHTFAIISANLPVVWNSSGCNSLESLLVDQLFHRGRIKYVFPRSCQFLVVLPQDHGEL